MNKEVRHFILETIDFGKFDVVEYKEYQKLNNIISELEKWLEEDLKKVYRDAGYRNNLVREVIDKLNELKEKE